MGRKTPIVLLVCLLATTARAQPAPPPGMQWQQTFDDEFNTLDTTKWNGSYAGTLWCGGEINVVPGGPGGCNNNFFGVSVVGGVLQLAAAPNQNNFANTSNRAVINTSGKFAQRYGYFEWRAQMPHDNTGEGDGLWTTLWGLPVGKADQSGGGCCHEEMDLVENVTSTTNLNVTNFTVHDAFVNEFTKGYPIVSAGNLSSSFHTYGLWWKQDASPHGTMCNYFDGVQQFCHTLTAPDTLWDNGIYLLEQVIPCPPNNMPFFNGAPCTNNTSSSDPMFVDYTRVYKLVSIATPTPTPTTTPTPVPTATPTPSPASPECTTIVTVGPAITDTLGNKWTITIGGNVAVNGITDTSTFNVIKLVYSAGYIYQQNTSGNWYRRNNRVGWAGVAAPACGTFGWSPSADSTIVGIATWIFDTSSAAPQAKLYLDNALVASTPPLVWDWDTTQVSNGQHTLREDNINQNGVIVYSSSAVVNVAN